MPDEIYLGLRVRPLSTQASDFIDKLETMLFRKALREEGRLALEYLVADLMRIAADDPLTFGYRPMSSGDFEDETVGYRGFRAAKDALYQADYLEVITGSKPTGPSDPTLARTTRIRLTDAFFDLAALHGIDHTRWDQHFEHLPRPEAAKNPVQLKTAKTGSWPFKIKGENIPIDSLKPHIKAAIDQIQEYNAFVSKQDIQPFECHTVFHRLFTQREGDIGSDRLDFHARIYSLGYSYQQWSQSNRAKTPKIRQDISINGEPVVEVDISASQLTILSARRGTPLDLTVDPYTIVPGVPRDVVKAWVTMTLGHTDYQKRWSKGVAKRYADANPGKILKDEYPIASTRQKILDCFPALRDWSSCSHRWGDLQYVESCIIMDTLHELAFQHGVLGLPVHDSIICPVSKEALVEQVLSDMFLKHVGIRPRIKVSRWP